MRVAVIGGTGCGGRAVVSTLRAAGYGVLSLARGQCDGPAPDVAADRHSPEAAAALRAFDPDAVVDQVAYGPDAVQATLAALRPNARYVLASSAIVYGPGRPTAYAEHEAPRPAPGLAAGKWAAERALAGRPGHTCLRIGAIYGPGHAPMTPFGRDPSALARLRAAAPFAIPDPDAPTLQPWFSGDHAHLVTQLVADPNPPRVLNAVGPETLGWGAWLAAWAASIGAPAPALRPLGPEALAAEAPAFMRPFIDALLDPPRLDPARLSAYAPGPRTPLAAGVAQAALTPR